MGSIIDYGHYIFSKTDFSGFGETIPSVDHTKTYKENFRENVSNLLKFAKQI